MITRKLRRTSTVVPLPAMADIAFNLLIFFIITSTISTDKPIPINLPIAQQSQSEKADSINLWVDQNGSVINNGIIYKNSNLTDLLIEYSKSKSDPKIFISADQKTPYIYINNVMEILKDCGINNIILVAKKDTSRVN